MRLRLRSRLRRMSVKGILLVVTGGMVLLAAVGGGVYAALGGTGSPQASGDVELQRGLIGWWKLDGNTKDSTPYNYAGAPTVSGTTSTADRKNTSSKALSFNGSGDNLTYNTTTAYNPGLTDSRTFSVWFKAGAQAHAGYLIWQNGLCRGSYIGINTSGYVYTALSTSSSGCTSPTYYQATTSVSYADNQWHLATAVVNRSGGTVTLYIDGVQRATASGVDTANSAIGGNFILGSDNTYTKTLSGSIDDVRIYNRALSVAEITSLYKSYDATTNLASGEKGLVGWWKLDGSAKDATPYANNGTINGTTAATSDRKGAANSAMTFDGSTSNIDIPAGYNIGTNGLTYAAWVYPTAYSGSYNMIMGHHLPYLDIYNSGGTPKAHLSLYANGVQRHVYGNTLLPLNHWYYIVGTYDTSGYMKVYVNGVLDGTNGPYTPYSTTYNGSTYHQFIGQFNAGGTYKFTGTIDEVRIYNRDLSATEIASQYASYNSQISLQASPSGAASTGNINAGLVGYWPFKGNARDATPYANNGTVTGATLTTDRRGTTNSAYVFSATSNVIGLPTSTILNNSVFTYTAWIKPTSFGTNGTIIGGSAVSGPQVVVRASTGCLSLNKQNAVTIGSSTVCPALNAWTHVAITYDVSGVVSFYINGTYNRSVTNPQTFTFSSFNIGKRSDTSESFVGSIADVRMYNRALSAAEITTIYNRP